jgi:hypothetical protein
VAEIIQLWSTASNDGETSVSISDLLRERERTHGSFKDHADATQALKRTMIIYGKTKLTNTQRESLDMIVHKIGRILAGNPDYIDHWDDIAGYAQLVADELRRKP